ncbi:hypothetical protein DL89DRAFT_294014 [Linderina pennispora]|uniref:Velvet domain-containing protein n=1 Tax=Linderina pennispora TaxID=61395 RepID=A0A1Y1W6F1_9FUNG|nr:uncharacterized protein DL89DRAFT_294014 [Linderina pennispora]ORX68826.1 hypothetical protein DL89DRAFT_294014 [Linderina pennispora]
MTYDIDCATTSSYSDSGSFDSSASFDEYLDKITVILEPLDANGLPQKINETHATDVVMHISLVSDDGTLDLELTKAGERLFDGTLAQSPAVSDNRMVFTFGNLKIRQTGTYRIRALAFNLSSIVPSMLTATTTATTTTTTTTSALAASSDAIVSGISEVLVVVQST